QAFAPKRQHD
ncbi:putative outer membrane receptor protein, partial [Vibrio parahaemolyticus VPCR-2009]